MNKLVSLIIPVYNVERYIRKCLDSVENQDYTPLQVIIVNDGSTDGSRTICEQYVEKNNGWQLINQDNQGLSSARNSGLEYAKGDYIAFLDSDDWIDSISISTLVNASIQYDAEIVEMGVVWKYPLYEKVDAVNVDCVFNMHEAMEGYLLQTQPIHSCVWNKLYKKELFEKLRFAIGRLHEDGFFTYQAIYLCTKYVALNYAGYYYRQNREGSIMNAAVKPKNITDVMDMMEERMEFFRKKDEPKLYDMAAAYYYRTILTNYVTCIKIIDDINLANKLRDKLKRNRKSIFKNCYLGNRKLKFLVFFFAPRIFRIIYIGK